MGRPSMLEEVPLPDLSDIPGVRIAGLADAVTVCRIDTSANRWSWRHATSARCRACIAIAVLTVLAVSLSASAGSSGLAVALVVGSTLGVVAVASVTPYDIRVGIRRTLRGSKRIVLLSDDGTAFLTIGRARLKGKEYWVLGRHASIRVGEGHGARLRGRIWGPLVLQADAQGTAIAALVPVRLEARLLTELQGARRTGWVPFARQVERPAMAT